MSNDHVHPIFAAILDGVSRSDKRHLKGQRVSSRHSQAIHPDDAREAFGVLAFYFGGVTADTPEAVRLYRHLEVAWENALLTLGAAMERRGRREFDREADRQYEYERSRDARQARHDEEADWDAIEKSARDAQRARW